MSKLRMTKFGNVRYGRKTVARHHRGYRVDNSIDAFVMVQILLSTITLGLYLPVALVTIPVHTALKIRRENRVQTTKQPLKENEKLYMKL